MIGSIRGRVLLDDPTSLVIEAGGVGYELMCPVGTLGMVEPQADGSVVLAVHTHLRQDALELFGFANMEERTAFRALVTVPNVGPRLALSVLSALPAAELYSCLESGDLVRLTKIPGVGKKTAERLVLELRGRLTPTRVRSTSAIAAPQREAKEKLTLALIGLGYKPAEAERAVRTLGGEGELSGDLSLLLRRALSILGA